MVSLETCVVQSSQVAACDLSGETAILHLESGIYYGLDAVGTRIWQLLAEPRPVRNIIQVLLGEYDVEPQQCAQDVLRLLEGMAEARLVEVRGAATA